MIILVKQKDLDEYIAEQERIHGKDFCREEAVFDFVTLHGKILDGTEGEYKTFDLYDIQKLLKKMPLAE